MKGENEMLTYNFSNIGSDSLYEFLYKCIKDDIMQGKLHAGEKLPSKRNLAKNLGISVITVENAYSQLSAEGYIYSVPKSGFYIAELGTECLKKKKDTYKQTEQKETKFSPIADFTSNQTESSVFPFTTWSKIMREVMNEDQAKMMLNPPCGGIQALRQNIASYLKEFRGMEVRPDQIIIGAGTEYLYGLLIQLLGTDRIYGIENPGYRKVAKVCESMRVTVRYIEMDEQGVNATSLEENGVEVMHLSPTHHFPTGIVMPISRRYELLGWATKDANRYIIEDDYDSELRLRGKPIPTLQSIDVSDKVIYMNTFSKTLCSTVRISYMVLPEQLAERYKQELSFYSCTVSNFEQYTLSAFIELGYFEKHINRLRTHYQKKRNVFLDAFLKGPLGPYVTIREEDAGVHFLMKINTQIKEEFLLEQASEKGIRLVPLSAFYHTKEVAAVPRNTYVMNYSFVDSEKAEYVAKTLYEIIH